MSLEDLLALNASGMVGSVLYRRLLDRFGSASAALAASERDLASVPGIGPLTARAIRGNRDRGKEEVDTARRLGVRLLAVDAPDYPRPLQALFDRPLVLYVRGDWRESDDLSIGIVGSRRCTPYGTRQALRFGRELADLGVTVVSGLARGIDTHAHRGALAPKEGRTVAVLGSGLERIYPPENTDLARRIAERGAVISEYPLHSTPAPENFPRRNRILAGLSLGILVVEAPERSGALITADWAVELGRDVFCLPGSVENPAARGGHLLLRQGAKLAEEVTDILEELPALAPFLPEKRLRLSPLEATLLRHLSREPLSLEQIQSRSRLPETQTSRALESLLGKGILRKTGSGWSISPAPPVSGSVRERPPA